jgi:hypothetical protein
MKMQSTVNWTSTPLFRAGINVITTPTQTLATTRCTRTLRFNVANIHEIKDIRNAQTR